MTLTGAYNDVNRTVYVTLPMYLYCCQSTQRTGNNGEGGSMSALSFTTSKFRLRYHKISGGFKGAWEAHAPVLP